MAGHEDMTKPALILAAAAMEAKDIVEHPLTAEEAETFWRDPISHPRLHQIADLSDSLNAYPEGSGGTMPIPFTPSAEAIAARLNILKAKGQTFIDKNNGSEPEGEA